MDLVADENSSKILENTKDRLSKLGLKNNTVNEIKNDDIKTEKNNLNKIIHNLMKFRLNKNLLMILH